MVKTALQNPKAADLNKDGKLSDYEEKRGAAIEKNLDEIDINDPVLMKMRAAKMKAANAGDDGNDKFFAKNAARLGKLKALKDKRAQIMSDMEQEAELEGGPIADRYGDMLNKIDKAIAMLQGQGEWGPEKDVDITAQEIGKRAAMIGLEEGSSTEEKRIAMSAIKRLAKYRGVSTEEAKADLLRAVKELGDLKEEFDLDIDQEGGEQADTDKSQAGILDAEAGLGLEEDLDLGHQDNEPHMIKAELYRIGKYAMELYQMVDGFEGEGEVDFPAWWQAKITTAMNNMVSSKHYLDFELKEPEIDAAVDAMTGEEPHMGEPQVMTVDLVGDEDEIEEGYLKASEVWRTLTGKNKKVVRKGAHTDTWKVPSSEDIQKMVDKDGGRYDDVLTNSVEFIGTDQGDYSLANATPDQVAKFKATLDPSDEFTPAIIGAIKDRIYKSGSKHHEERSDMVAPQTWKDHLQNLKWDIEKGTTKVMKRAGMLEEEAVNTRHIEDHEYMAAKIQKAMNGLDKSSEDYDSKLFILQKARKANNKGDFKTAMKIMKPFLAEVNELLDATPLPVVTKANSKIVDVPTMAKSLLDIYNDFKEREKIDFESNSYFKNAINFLTKAAQKQIDKETKATEVAETLAKQLKSK
jgi:hypothetical protein